MAIKPKKSEKKLDPLTVGAVKKAIANSAAKKAAKKPTPMGQSAKSHQASLAKISGTTAAVNAGKKLPAAGRNERIAGRNATVTYTAATKATKKTAASFKKSK